MVVLSIEMEREGASSQTITLNKEMERIENGTIGVARGSGRPQQLAQEGSVMAADAGPKFETRLPPNSLFVLIVAFLVHHIHAKMSDNGDSDPVYNNSHRAFLQSFLSRATLTFEEARPIVAAIEKAQGTRPRF